MEASAPPTRSEAQILRSLVENGVAKRFDLRAWCEKGCSQPTAMERLEVLLEQVRPDVAKLIVLEELEGTAEEDADVLVYGEIAARDFAALLEKHGDVHAADAGATDGRVFFDLGQRHRQGRPGRRSVPSLRARVRRGDPAVHGRHRAGSRRGLQAGRAPERAAGVGAVARHPRKRG
jgi:hypothetical protein